MRGLSRHSSLWQRARRSTTANHDLAAAITFGPPTCGAGGHLPITAGPRQRTAYSRRRIRQPKSRQFRPRGSGAPWQPSETTHAIAAGYDLMPGSLLAGLEALPMFAQSPLGRFVKWRANALPVALPFARGDRLPDSPVALMEAQTEAEVPSLQRRYQTPENATPCPFASEDRTLQTIGGQSATIRQARSIRAMIKDWKLPFTQFTRYPRNMLKSTNHLLPDAVPARTSKRQPPTHNGAILVAAILQRAFAAPALDAASTSFRGADP